MSLMYEENNNGPRTVPCGTPDTTGTRSDLTPLTTTLCYLKHKKLSYLLLSSSCGWMSKAFSKSKMKVLT